MSAKNYWLAKPFFIQIINKGEHFGGIRKIFEKCQNVLKKKQKPLRPSLASKYEKSLIQRGIRTLDLMSAFPWHC